MNQKITVENYSTMCKDLGLREHRNIVGESVDEVKKVLAKNNYKTLSVMRHYYFVFFGKAEWVEVESFDVVDENGSFVGYFASPAWVSGCIVNQIDLPAWLDTTDICKSLEKMSDIVRDQLTIRY